MSEFLAGGGDPASLAAALYERGWVSPNSAFVQTDVDGDGQLEVVVGLLTDPSPGGNAPTGSVFMWRCQDGVYVLTAVASPSRSDDGPPALVEARDLTGDDIPELVVAYPHCGAHTCFAQYAVLQWDGATMVDRFQGASDDIPSPHLEIRADDPNAPATIEITAGGIGSVGAGPFRTWSRTWTWDPKAETFTPGAAVFEPPRFRIHMIHDADDAFLAGELDRALALDQRAMEDDALLDWPSGRDGRAQLAAYAAYRRVLTYVAAGKREAAQAELDLRLSGREGASAAYGQVAQTLLEESARSGLPAACAKVRQFAQENPEAVLAPLDYGYANRNYTPYDICPVK